MRRCCSTWTVSARSGMGRISWPSGDTQNRPVGAADLQDVDEREGTVCRAEVNVLSDDKRQQVLALGQLAWRLRVSTLKSKFTHRRDGKLNWTRAQSKREPPITKFRIARAG